MNVDNHVIWYLRENLLNISIHMVFKHLTDYKNASAKWKFSIPYPIDVLGLCVQDFEMFSLKPDINSKLAVNRIVTP